MIAKTWPIIEFFEPFLVGLNDVNSLQNKATSAARSLY
jgi:hypothetical protein